MTLRPLICSAVLALAGAGLAHADHRRACDLRDGDPTRGSVTCAGLWVVQDQTLPPVPFQDAVPLDTRPLAPHSPHPGPHAPPVEHDPTTIVLPDSFFTGAMSGGVGFRLVPVSASSMRAIVRTRVSVRARQH